MQAAIKPVSYRSFDELLNTVKVDLYRYSGSSDIDAADLIKMTQAINYELGLRIYQWKETMLEIDHNRAKLPADFHQMQLALTCHHYTQVQNASWNGNVLLEEVCPQPGLTTCPCQQVLNAGSVPVVTTMVNCETITVPVTFPPGTTNVCAISITDPNHQLSVSSSLFCYNTNTNGVYTCGAPTQCNICNVVHTGSCPEVVINPYPLGKCRSICNDTVNIKILQYCESEVRCYEHYERLYIEPHRQASAFSTQGQFGGDYRKSGYIYNGFLETPHIDCGKVYIQYLGAMEDENGGLLVLDHEKINLYYEWCLKRVVLANVWLNGEDAVKQRLDYATAQEEKYKWEALSIVNTPNFRDCIRYLKTLKAEHDRNFYYPLSRFHGHIGFVNNVDNM